MKNLDIEKIKDKIGVEITTEEALKDVTPVEWSEDVLIAKKKVTVDGASN